MIPNYIKRNLLNDDKKFATKNKSLFCAPKYNPRSHYRELTSSYYFCALVILRHYIKLATDYYFSILQKAKNVDLFMLTPSVSSPMGLGSDSEAIQIKFGELETYLVDSSQFGFEPLLINDFSKVYCYLPSMRGEDPNPRHLNQFFHCEFEIKGTLDELIPIIEGYIKILCETILLMDNIVNKISDNNEKTKKVLKKIKNLKKFDSINFDDAVEILIKNKKEKYINFANSGGRDIKYQGEIELMRILKLEDPLWIKHFDRDRVAFYQKPCPEDASKVLNADLLFPPLSQGAFGGEVVGSGQRQNKSSEILESLGRQSISFKPYLWYINLRKIKEYQTTSGFGMGIERFVSWSLAKKDIKDVILYPRLKNKKTLP